MRSGLGAGSSTSRRRPGGSSRSVRPGRELPADSADLTDAHGVDGSDGSDGPPEDPERAYRVAREIALRKLETRDRTRSELADALHARATPQPIVDAVLDRLTEVGLVDDTRFARSWVETRQRTRRLAGRALSAELRSHGVADDLVAAAVDEIDPAVEQRAAYQLARDRVARSRGLPTAVVTRRVVGQLSRRGYDAGLAFRAVRAALAVGGLDADIDPVQDDGPVAGAHVDTSDTETAYAGTARPTA